MSLSQRLLLALLVCLPVPALAASGLALPLPSVVYQVVVGLAERTQAVAVGFGGFDTVLTEAVAAPAEGTIVLAPGEAAAASAPATGGIAGTGGSAERGAVDDVPVATAREAELEIAASPAETPTDTTPEIVHAVVNVEPEHAVAHEPAPAAGPAESHAAPARPSPQPAPAKEAPASATVPVAPGTGDEADGGAPAVAPLPEATPAKGNDGVPGPPDGKGGGNAGGNENAAGNGAPAVPGERGNAGGVSDAPGPPAHAGQGGGNSANAPDKAGSDTAPTTSPAPGNSGDAPGHAPDAPGGGGSPPAHGRSDRSERSAG